MKQVLTGLFVVLMLVGCGSKQEAIEKIVYRDKECPTPKTKPEFTPYERLN